jgi:hypothetical protein
MRKMRATLNAIARANQSWPPPLFSSAESV